MGIHIHRGVRQDVCSHSSPPCLPTISYAFQMVENEAAAILSNVRPALQSEHEAYCERVRERDQMDSPPTVPVPSRVRT